MIVWLHFRNGTSERFAGVESVDKLLESQVESMDKLLKEEVKL